MDVERTIEFLLQSSSKHDQQIRDINLTLARVADLQVKGMEMQIRAHEDWEARGAVQQQERQAEREILRATWKENGAWRREQEERWKAADIRSARIDAQIDRLGERIDNLVRAVGAITTRPPNQ